MAFRASRAYLAHHTHLLYGIVRLCGPCGIRVGTDRALLREEHLVVLAEEACGADEALGGGLEPYQEVVATEGARVMLIVLCVKGAIIAIRTDKRSVGAWWTEIAFWAICTLRCRYKVVSIRPSATWAREVSIMHSTTRTIMSHFASDSHDGSAIFTRTRRASLASWAHRALRGASQST